MGKANWPCEMRRFAPVNGLHTRRIGNTCCGLRTGRVRALNEPHLTWARSHSRFMHVACLPSLIHVIQSRQTHTRRNVPWKQPRHSARMLPRNIGLEYQAPQAPHRLEAGHVSSEHADDLASQCEGAAAASLRTPWGLAFQTQPWNLASFGRLRTMYTSAQIRAITKANIY